AVNLTSQRHESSFQRTKKKLNVKPESSILLSHMSPQHDHIIFNPPSTAPSVFHTPLKFVPKDDKRRQLLESMAGSTNSYLPPLVIKPKPNFQRHHLSEED